jgi:predicted alpha/beta-hydrolase family hydrolase
MTKVSTQWGDVSLLVDGDDGAPTIVLGHGAGGGMNSEFMKVAAAGLAARGLRVVRFNFPYMEQGRKSPDKAPILEGTFVAVAEHLGTPDPLFLGGKSMGGRIASMATAEGLECSGLVFHGYPLHPPGRPDRIRKDHLMKIEVPMLFIEGTRDPFCPLETLEAVRRELSLRFDLVVIDDGDHSFKVRKSSGRSTPDAWAEVIDVTADWVHSKVVS